MFGQAHGWEGNVAVMSSPWEGMAYAAYSTDDPAENKRAEWTTAQQGPHRFETVIILHFMSWRAPLAGGHPFRCAGPFGPLFCKVHSWNHLALDLLQRFSHGNPIALRRRERAMRLAPSATAISAMPRGWGTFGDSFLGLATG